VICTVTSSGSIPPYLPNDGGSRLGQTFAGRPRTERSRFASVGLLQKLLYFVGQLQAIRSGPSKPDYKTARSKKNT